MRVRKRHMNRSLLLFVSSGADLWLARRAIRPRPERSLAARTVLITGGSRGLGLVLAREYVAGGAQVAIAARDEDELRRAKEDLIQRVARSVLTLPCDLSDKGQIEDMVRNALEHFGLDILVINAGIIQVRPAEEMTLEDYEEAPTSFLITQDNASKFALVGFSEGLRAELMREGIVGYNSMPRTNANRESGECEL